MLPVRLTVNVPVSPASEAVASVATTLIVGSGGGGWSLSAIVTVALLGEPTV